MKKFLICVLVMSAAISASAQVKFGVKGGLNMSMLSMSDEDGDYDIDAKPSFYIGALAEFELQTRTSLAIELLYADHGAKYSEDGYEETFKMPSLMLPVLFKCEVVDNLNLGFGPYASYLLKREVEYEEEGIKVTADIGEYYKDVDFGACVDVEYNLSSGLFVNARYNLGLANIAKDFGYDEKSKLSALQIGVGFKF